MNEVEGGILNFASEVEAGHSFEDCIVVKCVKTYWLIVPFREDFLKIRISKSKYEKLLNNDRTSV
jgi:hypothetical protein